MTPLDQTDIDTERRLNPCPDCGNLCSVEAKHCPRCGKPFVMDPEDGQTRIDDNILTHVLNQSSMKVGMCLTLLGLIKVVEGVKNVRSLTDELLALDAVGFLLSSILSYFALKDGRPNSKRIKARAGDLIFSVSLCLLAIICAIAFIELI